MLLVDAVVFIILTVSALIHDLSASLMPPVLLLFFICCKKSHCMMHYLLILSLMVTIYAVMLKFFAYADSDVIAESWSQIYGNPDLYRYNDGLLSVADKVRALECMSATLKHLSGFDFTSLAYLLIAVAMPLVVLLSSGIRVLRSSSSRAQRIRIMLLISAAGPIGLCLVGNDFGRWYSICAINFTAYSLLIAHPANRTGGGGSTSEGENIKQAVLKCFLIAATIVLLNYRLDCWGNFYKSGQNVLEYARQVAANTRQCRRPGFPAVRVIFPGHARPVFPATQCQVLRPKVHHLDISIETV